MALISNDGTQSTDAPLERAAIAWENPNTPQNGMACNTVAFGLSRSRAVATFLECSEIVAWLCTTNFGKLVVPDVVNIIQLEEPAPIGCTGVTFSSSDS